MQNYAVLTKNDASWAMRLIKIQASLNTLYEHFKTFANFLGKISMICQFALKGIIPGETSLTGVEIMFQLLAAERIRVFE